MKIEARSIIVQASKRAKSYFFPQDHSNDPYPDMTRGEIAKRRTEVKLESFEDVLKLVPTARTIRVEMALLIDPATKSFIDPHLVEGSRFVIDDGDRLHTFQRPYSPHTLNPSLEALKRRDLDIEAIKEAAGENTIIISEQDQHDATVWQRSLVKRHTSIPPSGVPQSQLTVPTVQEVVSFPLKTVHRIPRSPVTV